MLTAKLHSGEVVSLAETMNKNYLESLRRKEVFYCPTCGDELILKLGEKRIYHFAHRKNSKCLPEYERESDYHLSGKLKLHEWIKSQGLEVKLEHYYPEIKQRADLAFTYGQHQYCIEFQCAPISEEVFRKRTKGYQKLAIEPLWILGGKNIQRRHSHKTSLTSFHYLFLKENKLQQFYLPAFCPQTNQYIQLDNLLTLSTRNAFCHFSLTPLMELRIDDFLAPNISKLPPISDWLRERQHFKIKLLGKRSKETTNFLTELYSSALNPYYLPPFVGIPLKYSLAIETPSFIWQGLIFLKHFHGCEQGKRIYFHEIYTTVLLEIQKGKIKRRSLPSIKRNILPFAIEEYLELLAFNGVLKKVKKHHFIINKSMKMANNMEEWMQEDRVFYTEFYKST